MLIINAPIVMDIADKVIIVTGASSGIGRACAADFVRHGANVVLVSRRRDVLLHVAAEIDPQGNRTLVVEADVTSEMQCQVVIEHTVHKFGRIDVLVCNAGVSMRASFDDVKIDVLKRLMDVNFWGVVYCVRYALPYLLESRGTIVGVNSVAGYIGLPGRTGYSASKFAMRGFLDTIRNEYLNRGLSVFVIAPGFTESNVRYSALTADGSPQGFTPRDESSMMTSEEVAREIRSGIMKNKRFKVLTFVHGKLALFLQKWWPSLVSLLANKVMLKEPNSPVI